MRVRAPGMWRITRYRMARIKRPMRSYAGKFGGDGSEMPPRPRWEVILIAWIGALAAMATLGGLAQVSQAPLVMAPFGASAVLLFGHPESPLTQPRNVLGGHCLGGVIGLATGTWLGTSWPLMALAVATTIALMKATRTVHPPAGATAIVCMSFAPDWWRLLAPVLSGSALLVVAAAIYNNAIEHRRYPRHWW